MVSIPGLGRSLGGGHGNPLQYSCLESTMHRGAWKAVIHGAAKSWTSLSTRQLMSVSRSQLYHLWFEAKESFPVHPKDVLMFNSESNLKRKSPGFADKGIPHFCSSFYAILCFYEGAPLGPVFINRKKSKEDFHFYEKRWKSKNSVQGLFFSELL